MRAANKLERVEQRRAGASNAIQQAKRIGALRIGEREQQVFRRDEFIAQRFRLFLGRVDDLIEFAAE